MKKVISGGQTGADMAGLIAAKKVGLETGGTAPEGFMTENGENQIELQTHYGLVTRGSNEYRTKQNVDDADSTLVLLVRECTGGTAKTIGWASRHCWEDSFDTCLVDEGAHRPVLVLKAHDLEIDRFEESATKIVDFVIQTNTQILNVAGHRQSAAFPCTNTSDTSSPPPPPPYDFQQRCIDLLSIAFNKIIISSTASTSAIATATTATGISQQSEEERR